MIEDSLRQLRNAMMREAIERFGAVSPAGGKESLSESFSLWEPRRGPARLVLWFNTAAGSTHIISRPVPAELMDRLDRNGRLLPSGSRPLMLGADIMAAAREAFAMGAREFTAKCTGGLIVTVSKETA